MERNIFRKISMERISSPEQLNDYIRLCNPSLWIVLAAAILLLAGTLVWGSVARLDTTLDAVCVRSQGQAVLYIKEADIDSVKGKTLTVEDVEYEITEDMCAVELMRVSGELSEYAMYAGDLTPGEWVCPIIIDADLPDGIYAAQIVTDSVSPLFFVIN